MGGWRVIRTLGLRMIKLETIDGFSAETGGELTLTLASQAGIPLRTTHTVRGAVLGAGAAHRLSTARWSVATNLVVARATTIPACALVAALALWLLRKLDISGGGL